MFRPDSELRSALDGAIADLGRRLPDRLIKAGDDGYEAARTVWNARIDRRPAAVVRPLTAGDVGLAIRIAADRGLPVAVRGGGHSIAGHGVPAGGLMLDLTSIDEIAVDPQRRIARVGGGRSWGPVDRATAEHGLAMTGGQISTTGVGGLTLGGGVGWLMGVHGLTIDHLRAATLIDANGESHEISASTEPELFWAIRGGGGNFGVVTSFEFDLHPRPPVLAGTLIHPIDRAADIVRLFADVSLRAPDELTVMVLLLGAPDQPHIPVELRGRDMALLAACWAGDLDEGEHWLADLRSFGPPLVDRIRRMPYTELQTMFDFGSRPGFHNYWRSPFIKPLADPAIRTIAEFGSRIPTAGSQVLLTNMGGAVRRVDPQATAFAHRQAAGYLEIIGKWAPGEDGAGAVSWADDFASAIEPASTGFNYVNFLDEAEPGGVHRAYPGATFARLVELKRRYDPLNIFRSNHNIPPDTSG